MLAEASQVRAMGIEEHKLGYKDVVSFVHVHIHTGRILPSTYTLHNYFLMSGHLGHFQYFAITNNDARNTLCISIFKLMEVYLQGGLLGQKGSAYVALPKSPGETACISTSKVWVCFPQPCQLNLLSHFTVFASLKGDTVSLYCFNLHFSDYKWVWTLFLYVQDNFYSFWDLVTSVFSFSIWVFWLFVLNF